MRLRDLGPALLLTGSLQQIPGLEQAGQKALSDLAAAGYQTADPALANATAKATANAEPISVRPLSGPLGDYYGSHGGLYQDGKIYIRTKPIGPWSPATYLRHELAHAASSKQCRRKPWEEEAFALWFSHPYRQPAQSPTPAALAKLRRAISLQLPLGFHERDTLRQLLNLHGWPNEACRSQTTLRRILEPGTDSDLSYRLIALASGRMLYQSGHQAERWPLGSLWKVPYAASLKTQTESHQAAIATALLHSDPQGLKGYIWDRGLYQQITGRDPYHSFAVLMGLRSPADGGFPLSASLTEAALLLRHSFLVRPEVFAALSDHNHDPQATLSGLSNAAASTLATHQIMAKTGTVASPAGVPLWGHVMFAWPAPNPEFLAVFRQRGKTGRQVAAAALRQFRHWPKLTQVVGTSVAVHVATKTPQQAVAVGPQLGLVPGWWRQQRIRFRHGGQITLQLPAPNPKQQRTYQGLLLTTASSTQIITDPITYTEGVIAAEAAHLKGAARNALAAIVHHNSQVTHRPHVAKARKSFSGLCDTTHCSVFHGTPAGAAHQGTYPALANQWYQPQPDLLSYLNSVSSGWLRFAQGGSDPWQQQISRQELGARLAKDAAFIYRNRDKSGEVTFTLAGPDQETVLPCEYLRNQLKLLSCPDQVANTADGGFVFSGHGAGHGSGLRVAQAALQAAAGMSAQGILAAAFAGGRERIGQ